MLYKKLVPIRRDVEARGLPKIWTVTSSVDAISLVAAQTVHYHAFLSQAMPWSVDITDAAGTLVRRFTGGDGAIEATWNGRMADGVTPVPPGTYTATMRAQAGDRIAREAVLTTIVNP
jgi:flagellar hook assembly protein FlgD